MSSVLGMPPGSHNGLVFFKQIKRKKQKRRLPKSSPSMRPFAGYWPDVLDRAEKSAPDRSIHVLHAGSVR